MLEQKKRFLFEKLKQRLDLISPLYIRNHKSIGVLKYFEHEQIVDGPILGDDVDDSGWREIKAPCHWGKWNRNFTLRGSFSVPEGWGKKGAVGLNMVLGLTPRWDLSHPESLLYIDGQEIASFDRNHHLVLVPEKYCDGKEHRIVLHGFTGRWWTYDNPPAIELFMEKADVVEIDDATREFIATVRVALGTAEIFEDDNIAKSRILTAVDKCFKVLDTLEPIGERFYNSVPEAHKVLKKELKCAGEPIDVNIVAVGHSHIDVAWLWELNQTRRKCVRTFNTMLRLMDQYEDFKFTQSQPQLYDFVKQDNPELFKKIKDKVAEGRWEILGGMWVEADCNLSGSESLARQFLLGRKFFAENFGEGVESPIMWLPDVFGYSANLPQLIKQAGLEYFFTIKMSWNQYNSMPYDSFWWEGLDGTKVLTHTGSTRIKGKNWVTYGSFATPYDFYNTWASHKQKESHEDYMICFGHSDGGGGPTQEMLENINEMKEFPALPKVKHGKAIDFFRRLEKNSGDKLPKWVGELYLEYHRGTYTSQAKTKNYNRRCEFGLHDSEFLNSLASIIDSDYEYPFEEFTKGWQLVCLNQFHDIIPGSSIKEVYEDSNRQYEQVLDIVKQTSERALEVIGNNSGGDVVFVNPTSFERKGLVKVDIDLQENQTLHTIEGEVLSWQKSDGGILVDSGNLSAYGVCPMKIVETGPMAMGSGLIVNETLVENEHIRLMLNGDGDIVSIYDKDNDREIVPTGCVANQMQAFEDRPMNFDAWDIDIYYDDKIFYSEAADSISIVEDGPLRGTIEIKRKILESDYIQRISLDYNSRRIDIETEIDWKQRKSLLKVALPVNVHSSQASYEVQWGHVKRPTHQNTSWDWARFETCAHKWVDLSEFDYGVSVLNDCKYGHDIRDNVIRITLLRSAVHPDPKADEGVHRFKYCILPHEGRVGSETVRAGYELNDPVIVYTPKEKVAGHGVIDSMFRVDRDNIVIETIKRAEDGNGFIVRLYDSLGGRGTFTLSAVFDIEKCYMTDLLEKNTEQIDTVDNSVVVEYGPFEIINLKIQ